LEALVAMLSRYPQQFVSSSSAILKELFTFLQEGDLQVAALALKAGRLTMTLKSSAPENK